MKNINWTFNVGWCYGNASIVHSLMQVCANCEKEKRNFYEKSLKVIINQPIKKYNLETPIVCHGYASVLAIQIAAYEVTGNKQFLDLLDRNCSQLLREHEQYITKNISYINDYSLFGGAGGVFLVLLRLLDVSLDYDQLLMLLT